MTLFRRGKIWWLRLEFQGSLIRESTGLTNKEAARDVHDNRRLKLREGRADIKRAPRVPLFSIAAESWLKAKIGDWAPKTVVIERTNVGHLEVYFRNRLLSDIDPADVAAYREKRLLHDAADKTISLELGTLRAVMLFYDLDAKWKAIRKKVKLKKARKLGRVITHEEETALLRECRASRSRSLPIAITVALQTCMRSSEIRLLQWHQIDFGRRVITVGDSKTDAGTGREIPMTSAARRTMELWAGNFPNRKPNYYVFPSEKVGQNGAIYALDVTRPIGTWKEAWEAAKERAGVSCRFHDLRHSGCTRLLESGVSYPILAEIMGWSASTATRMAKEVYGHVGLAARRQAIEQLEQFTSAQESSAEPTQKPTQSDGGENVTIQ
jgi:integrase